MTAMRYPYIDGLRIFALGVVFLYHGVHLFDPMYWFVKNADTTPVAAVFTYAVFLWIMPLFFALAGVSSYYALRTRAPRDFLHERVLRLGAPFVLGVWLLTLPQKYLEALCQFGYSGSWMAWLGEGVLRHFPLRGSPAIFFTWGYHLWFLPFLLLFSAGAVGLWRLTARQSPDADRPGLPRTLTTWPGCLLLPLPLLALNLARPLDGDYCGWTDFLYWFNYLAYGYLLLPLPGVRAALARLTWPAVGVAMGCLIGIGGYYLSTDHPGLLVFPRAFSWGYTGFALLWTAYTLASLIAILGLGIRHLTAAPRWFPYAGEAAPPIFMLHQPVILIIGYYVVQWPCGILPKLLAVLLGGLLATLGIYELLIRRIPLLRFLFGMRPRAQRPTPARVPASV